MFLQAPAQGSMCHAWCCSARIVGVLLSSSTALTGAQRPDTSSVAGKAPHANVTAEQYQPVFEQFRRMALRSDSVAPVHNLTLRRDVIEFHLEDGNLFLGTPVAGRTIGAAFVGHGSVSLTAPVAIERRELRRVLGDSTLNARISAVAFLFTDSTLSELLRQVTFGPRPSDAPSSGVLSNAIDRLVVNDRWVLEPTLMTGLLNGDTNGFFYARVKREHGEDLTLITDPAAAEAIELLRDGREGEKVQLVSEFRSARDLADSTATPAPDRAAFELGAYQIDATIAKGLDFSATATVRLTARRDDMRWARLVLLSDLRVDSLRDDSSATTTFFRGSKNPELWVRFDPPLRRGETRAVRVVYHGDLIGYTSVTDKMSRWFPIMERAKLPPAHDKWLYVKSSYAWFPRYGNQAADVDLTFHIPKRYRVASIGRLVESHLDGDVMTTRWTTARPANQVCFSLGELDEFKINDPRIPAVTVHTNGDAHRQLNTFFLGMQSLLAQHGVDGLFFTRLLSSRAPEEDVGSDVANSLAFFTSVYGPPLFDRYYAAEIPFSYGQAFPGLIYLPVWTFQAMGDSGYDEILRAHEMAHQWWGIGVEPAGYRDHWLSEGFAEFSGWWYMQMILRDNEKFFKHLDHWRREIRSRRRDAPPIGIGTRAADLNERDYRLMTYFKGAWILQMLRNLMLDFRTMKEDAFAAMMADFYQQYRGKRATTRDFQHVVERHLDAPMDWFFDEWVNRTAIPTYIFSWRADSTDDHKYTVRLRIRQEDVSDDFMMLVPVRIELENGGHAFVRVSVHGPRSEAAFRLPARPTEVELNPLQSVLAEVKTEDWE
jgi:Peptidase family M1 domain